MKAFLKGFETGWRLPHIWFCASQQTAQQGFHLGSWARRFFVR